jgi:F420-0:gamma-glutamyl ligase
LIAVFDIVGGGARKGVGIAAGVAGIGVLDQRKEKVDRAGWVIVVVARRLKV